MKLCRNCTHWKDTQQWRGNCPKHPSEIDGWTETANIPDCPDYDDKQEKYAQYKGFQNLDQAYHR